jgi:sulfofructose kinase
MATAAAATVARLGGPVELWARVGDDQTGEAFLLEIAGEGVDASHVRRVRGARTAFSTILVDPAGERLVVPYTDPSLDSDPGWLPLERVAQAGAVLVDVRWVEGAEVLLREARRRGIPTILDADIAPLDILRRLIALADHVLFSEPALLSLTSAAEFAAALQEVAALCEASVIGVTLGEHGALLWERRDPDRTRSFPAPSIRAVDTLNAGDVWHGTYAYGLVAGWDLERSVTMANLAAAMKCEHFGGRLGSPTLQELVMRGQEADLRSVESDDRL